MNRRGFIRSAAGVMASVLAGRALVPAAPTAVSLPRIAAPVCYWKPITLKVQTLTGQCYLTRDLIADGVMTMNQIGKAMA